MNKGIPIIKKYEGLKLEAYLCPAKVATIGWGNTFYENGRRVQMGDKIDIRRAEQLLQMTVNQFETAVRNVVRVPITDNQLGALTSFAFNAGVGSLNRSTLLRKVNANPNDPTIRDEFMRWTKAGGKVLRGLQRRRAEEADLYFS